MRVRHEDLGYGCTPSSVQWSMWSVPETGKPESPALMDPAHEHGLNFCYSSNVDWKQGEGCSEQIIGR